MEIEPFEVQKKLIPIQAFPHFEPFPADPKVLYFALSEFEAVKRIDLD